MTLHPDLEDARRQIEAVLADARTLTDPLSDEQMNWRPSPGHWSIAECVGHLSRTGVAFVPGIKAAMEQAQKSGGPFRYGWLESWAVSKMDQRGKIKVKAPKGLEAPPACPKAECLREFEAVHKEILEWVTRANGLHLSKTRVRHPFLPIVRYSLCGTFRMIAGHCRRHLAQAREVRSAPGFPVR
ncbi:MAG: DinB family protein [Bryobacteraceae bacterium]|nr:DinB family protein [Bryobacteraceae bacterium]